MKENKILTRKDEIRYITSNPKKMLGRFIARDVIKTYKEDFVDQSTGQVVSVDRNEVLFTKGTYIDQDILAQIRFNLEAGDIKEIDVSNQNRKGALLINNSFNLYKGVANIIDKKHSFLLYANSVLNANIILTDYIELHYKGGFYLVKIEEIDTCYVIVDNIDIEQAQNSFDVAYLKEQIDAEEYINTIHANVAKNDYPDHLKMNFYKIIARITTQDGSNSDSNEFSQTFIVHTNTATRANLLIEQKLRNLEEERYMEYLKKGQSYEKKKFVSQIEESKIIPIGTFIPKEFSLAYQNEQDDI